MSVFLRTFATMNDNEIAIIDGNALSLLGMKTLLGRVVPQAEVRAFSSFRQLVCDCPDAFIHYFVSAQVLLEHTAFFRERRQKVVVLVNGLGTVPEASDFHILNIATSEESLVRSLLRLMQLAHQRGRNLPKRTAWEEPCGLSPREIDVLRLIVRGYINKEIADHLHISLTTVITHRKSIMDKLNIRSVSGLTIYAVMNGYVEVDEI